MQNAANRKANMSQVSNVAAVLNCGLMMHASIVATNVTVLDVGRRVMIMDGMVAAAMSSTANTELMRGVKRRCSRYLNHKDMQRKSSELTTSDWPHVVRNQTTSTMQLRIHCWLGCTMSLATMSPINHAMLATGSIAISKGCAF
ncbi:hypothetical protein EV180_006817 [Coemansia sp. RSA 518]|nr:hypothetical protein EV180_006817 [Coemansia sp. RSA 518]